MDKCVEQQAPIYGTVEIVRAALPCFKQMLQQEDKADFVKTTMKEVSDHKAKGHWEMVPISEKPANAKWISIRFLLVVAQALQLNAQAIYFTLAFPQVHLEVSVYAEILAGMYGIRRWNWHEFLLYT